MTSNYQPDILGNAESYNYLIKWPEIVWFLEGWLDIHGCKYVAERNNLIREDNFRTIPNGSINLGGHQETFFAMLAIIFKGYAPFYRIITFSSPHDKWYATEMWKQIYNILDPADNHVPKRILDNMDSIIFLSDGNQESWMSTLQGTYHFLSTNQQTENIDENFDQVKDKIRRWTLEYPRNGKMYTWKSWLEQDIREKYFH